MIVSTSGSARRSTDLPTGLSRSSAPVHGTGTPAVGFPATSGILTARIMTRSLLAILVLASAAMAQTWPEEVNLAIDRGVHRLLTLQASDGSIRGTHHSEYPLGETSLAV